METKIFTLVLFIMIASILTSCTKAGKGGDATVVCTVWNTDNNSSPVNGATVYVAYDLSSAPSQNTSGYDDHQVCSATTNTVAFSGLKKGTYYFMAVGTQTVTSSSGTSTVQVTGGAPYSLNHGSSTNNATVNVGY